MRNPISYLEIITIVLFALSSHSGKLYGQDIPDRSVDVHEWVKNHFSKGKVPPFSFVYEGKSSNNFIKNWQFKKEKLQPKEPNSEETLFTYSDKKSGLAVKCKLTVFDDFQAVEWVLHFINTSGQNTPLIERTFALDYKVASGTNGAFILHHLKGSKGSKDDFMPLEDTLTVGKKITLSPGGGRSSDNNAFPFFNIKDPVSNGFVVAIGWSGKWYSDICQTNENTLSLKAGMERMKLILYPKEEIRTPGICILFWKGEESITGHNQFRKFLLIHKIRRNSLPPPLAASLSPNTPGPCNGFFGCLSDSFALAKIAKLKQYNIVPEVCWMDAGWYQNGGSNWQITGNWNPDKERFPSGLKPVVDATHSIGAKFLLWFEPERVVEGTPLATEHESWLFKLPGDKKNSFTGKKDFVLNLGNKEAHIWLTDYISDFIKKEGIDYYRQDFNIDPLPYWEANDIPRRTGISEIRYIEGLYNFWDSLLVRFPNLIIDNCASGGRRIDLETISRSLPLWRSDYNMDEPEGLQNHTYGLNFYLPLHGTGNYSYSTYQFRSAMGSSMVLFWDVFNSGSSIPEMQKCMNDFNRLRPYYYGDYYPLTSTENLLRDNTWLAYQMDRPEKGHGIIMAFRRENCPDDSIRVKLKGIDKVAFYEMFDEDAKVKTIKKGKDLLNGITLFLAEREKSLLMNYTKQAN